MASLIVYVDTHVVVALAGPKKKIPKRALTLLRRALTVKLSPASVLELQLLREIGRLNASADDFIDNMREAFPVVVCDRPFEAVARAAMSLTWTRDPFDRLIVAHASLHDSVLLTKDGNMHTNYANAQWD